MSAPGPLRNVFALRAMALGFDRERFNDGGLARDRRLPQWVTNGDFAVRVDAADFGPGGAGGPGVDAVLAWVAPFDLDGKLAKLLGGFLERRRVPATPRPELFRPPDDRIGCDMGLVCFEGADGLHSYVHPAYGPLLEGLSLARLDGPEAGGPIAGFDVATGVGEGGDGLVAVVMPMRLPDDMARLGEPADGGRAA